MANSSRPPILLTIEDDDLLRATLTAYFSPRGYQVLEAGDGRQGLELFADHRPDIVLLDLRLPRLDGLEVLKEIHGLSPDPR